MAKRRPKIRPAWWERGYLSHHYWSNKSKIGSVMLCRGPSDELLYQWMCIHTNASGYASTLAEAKASVESAYKMGWVQASLEGVPAIEDALKQSRQGQSSHIGKAAARSSRKIASTADSSQQIELPV